MSMRLRKLARHPTPAAPAPAAPAVPESTNQVPSAVQQAPAAPSAPAGYTPAASVPEVFEQGLGDTGAVVGNEEQAPEAESVQEAPGEPEGNSGGDGASSVPEAQGNAQASAGEPERRVIYGESYIKPDGTTGMKYVHPDTGEMVSPGRGLPPPNLVEHPAGSGTFIRPSKVPGYVKPAASAPAPVQAPVPTQPPATTAKIPSAKIPTVSVNEASREEFGAMLRSEIKRIKLEGEGTIEHRIEGLMRGYAGESVEKMVALLDYLNGEDGPVGIVYKLIGESGASIDDLHDAIDTLRADVEEYFQPASFAGFWKARNDAVCARKVDQIAESEGSPE